VGFGGYTLIEKQKLEKENLSLQDKLIGLESREKKYVSDIKQLESKLSEAQNAKTKLENDITDLNKKLKQQQKQTRNITKARNNWKNRTQTLRKERDELLAKLQEVSEPQIVYKEVIKEVPVEKEPETQVEAKKGPEKFPARKAPRIDERSENYWAAVLKRKAALEVEIQSFKEELSARLVEIAEIKKKNSDMEMELGRLRDERDAIERQVKHGKDVASTLSLDLARAKNENKFLSERMEKMGSDNETLREKIRQLTSTKIALEKSIVRLTEEKNDVEKKLFETENVIQSRIDEIWEIKESIDTHFQESPLAASKEIEIPPIVVSADAEAKEQALLTKTENIGFLGNVVSINPENNFVIADLGETSGVEIGDTLSVYRGSKYIAGLEVIQTRKDICAADIKQKVADIKVGDVVR
jgi:predicted  nucleic acid-binding Zn-ribbon protein